MSESLKVLKKLVEFIEENDVKDEIADGGDGHTDIWRSVEFDNLIDKAKEVIANEMERTK
jgi:hypothetical protein